jgi:glucose-6-phosphate isomerase
MLTLSFKHSKVSIPSSLKNKLNKHITFVKKETTKQYTTNFASLYLPHDKKLLRKIKHLAKQYNNTSLIIVVGIGGSNLGTIAIADAVLGTMKRQQKMLFCDTIDDDWVAGIKEVMVNTLKKKKKVLLNIVTKSGSTTETIANAQILLHTLQHYQKNWKKYVVITTDFGSKLWHVAKKQELETLEIPKLVGGRYSVFSAVSLFPLAVAGINITQLLQGAKTMKNKCLQKDNPAATGALHLYKNNKPIYTTFIFSKDLENIGKWYRQLMGESIGKEWNATHTKRVWQGITPTISIGSTDLHSLAQLYLGGPRNKYTTFIDVKNKHTIQVPAIKDFDILVKHIQKRKLQTIMKAILQGTKIAFKKGKRSFSEITLPKKDAYHIGQLLQLKMIEIMYLGFLLNVNPFDQPNVELYKKETRRLL